MKYKVSISNDDKQLLSRKEIKNIKKQEDNINFETNEKSAKLLSQQLENIRIVNQRKEKTFGFIKKYLISIIGLILIAIFIINQSRTIKSITFVNTDTYSKEVNEYVDGFLVKRGPFKYLNDSLVNINTDLRQHFYYYEWISVSKKGNKLYVNIEKQDQRSYINENSNIKGDIIAKKDGIIDSMYIKKGVAIAKDGQTVLAGQMLISGNLKINNDGVDYIHPLAIVIASVIDYENITVPKSDIKNLKTGKIETKTGYTLFGKLHVAPSNFDNYIVETKILRDWKFYQKIKNIYYETNDIEISYTKDEALEYAKSIIRLNFMNNKIDEHEKIIFIEPISETEDSENYYFKFIVKKLENIASFQAVSLENNP